MAEKYLFGNYAIRHIEIQTNADGHLLKPSTQQHYFTFLKNRLSVFENIEIRDIDKPLVDELFAAISKDGKLTTASKSYKLLATVMDRAVKDKIRLDNPCSIRGAQSLKSGKKVAAPTVTELGLLVSAITPRYKTLLLLAAYAGLRFSEVSELRVGDLKKVDGPEDSYFIADVKRAVTFVAGKFLVGSTKSAAGVRDIEVTSQLTPLLDSLLAKRMGGGKNALLFPAAGGAHLRNDVLATALKRAKAKVDLADSGLTPHSLRHFGGTQFSAAGGSLVELKKWLGDSSDKAALGYLHPVGKAREIAERMPLLDVATLESIEQ